MLGCDCLWCVGMGIVGFDWVQFGLVGLGQAGQGWMILS